MAALVLSATSSLIALALLCLQLRCWDLVMFFGAHESGSGPILTRGS
jgi:hypothetical protein